MKIEDLPEDITTEILSRLPAESILRCKRVRKSWYALLARNPNFVAKHLAFQHQSSGDDKHVFLKRWDSSACLYPEAFSMCTLSADNTDCYKSPCVAQNNLIGFGYDYKIKDYKLVRVVNFYSCGVKCRVEVFCIRTDSCWRQLDDILDTITLDIGRDTFSREPYFEGACYWWAHSYETRKGFLISFHMTDEVFTKIPVPTLGSTDYWDQHVSVGVYKKSIALYIYPEGYRDQIDIWAMKEFGVEESWSKQLSVKLPVDGHVHLGFWNGTDKEFLCADRDGKLAICNRFTMEYTSLSMPEPEKLGQ